MATITVTVIEHAATDKRPWRVTAHDGNLRLTLPVVVGFPIEETDHQAIHALASARHFLLADGEHTWFGQVRDWQVQAVGLTKGGHRRYRVTY